MALWLFQIGGNHKQIITVWWENSIRIERGILPEPRSQAVLDAVFTPASGGRPTAALT